MVIPFWLEPRLTAALTLARAQHPLPRRLIDPWAPDLIFRSAPTAFI